MESAEKVQAVGKKCTDRRCRKVINVGTKYIVIEGALTVPFNTNKGVAQKFYYCLDVLCITNRLPWANIRPLLELTFDSDITDDRKRRFSANSTFSFSKHFYLVLKFILILLPLNFD